MYHGEDGKVDSSTWQQLIPVSDEMRQKMFDNVKREFIQENGISNGDTTKRSQIFREYQLQFTASSGRHSVLERPFSEANGRPFVS